MGYTVFQHTGSNKRLTSFEEKKHQAGDVWRLVQLDARNKGMDRSHAFEGESLC